MIKISISVLTFCLVFLLISCDRPECTNTNEIFDKYAPNTREYKDELVKQLKLIDKSKLTYWMSVYHEEKNSKYIRAHIQGDGLCAKIELLVKDSQKGIEGIIKHKGMSYSGAELEELKFEIIQDSTTTEFVFEEISGIVD